MKKAKTLSALLFLITLLMSGCFLQPKKAEKPVTKIGFIGPLTGDGASWGADSKNGLALAASELGDIQVIYEDAACSGQQAATAAQKLINIDHVQFIIGGICSGETLAAAPIAEAARAVLVSPASESPDISQAGDYIFRTWPSADSGIRLVGQEIKDKFQRVALISEQDEFGMGNRKILLDIWEEEDVIDETYLPGNKDFRTALAKIRTFAPQAIFMNHHTDETALAILQQIKEAGLDLPIYTNTNGSSEGLAKEANNLAQGLTFPELPTDLTGDFQQKFTSKFGQPQAMLRVAATTYDTVYLLHKLISEYGYDATQVKDALYQTEYSGVVGKYQFDKNGDLVGAGYRLRKYPQ